MEEGEYPQEINDIAKELDGNLFQHDLLQIDFNPQGNLSQVKDDTGKGKKKGRPKGYKTNKTKAEDKHSSSDKNKGHWVHEENKRYHWFLEIYSNHFILKKLRRMDKIFKSMADFIGTREPQQCRSHHQKMEKKFNTFNSILKNLRKEFYLSADPRYVKCDFENNNITEYDPLISEEALQNDKQISYEEAQQGQANPEFDLEPKKNQNQHKMLLSDHYQQQFQL